MPNHTPGPWYIEKYAQPLTSRGFIIRSQVEDLSAVACVPQGTYDDLDGKHEPRANARLIVAAPELLETIQSLLKLPTAVAQLQYLHKGIGTSTENNIWLIAEELVKKIEGK